VPVPVFHCINKKYIPPLELFRRLLLPTLRSDT
jgi:hypothetical protein